MMRRLADADRVTIAIRDEHGRELTHEIDRRLALAYLKSFAHYNSSTIRALARRVRKFLEAGE